MSSICADHFHFVAESAAPAASNEYLDAIAKAKVAKAEGTDYVFDDRDVILYSTLLPFITNHILRFS